MTGASNNQLVTPPNSTGTCHHQEASRSSSSRPTPKNQSTKRLIKQTTNYLISLTNASQSSKFKIVLNHFITELLKRSRSTLPIFQMALKYYVMITSKLNKYTDKMCELVCIKKRLLGCLILSFKYHFDCQYSFKSWGKISGLSVKELQKLEFQTLTILDYKLNISPEDYQSWVSELTVKMLEFDEKDQVQIITSCSMSALKRSIADSTDSVLSDRHKRLRTV